MYNTDYYKNYSKKEVITMKMNFTFSVIARCKKFESGVDITPDIQNEKVDIELHFDMERAMRFLFRFFEPGLMIDDYKVILKNNITGKFECIALFKDDYTYLVLNENQVINDVIKGYNYLVTMNKVVDIMEFDFEAALDLNDNKEVEDEFESK